MKTLAIILLLSTISFSQVVDNSIICPVEVSATIIGGLDSLHMHLNWPDSAKQFDIEGRVYVVAFLDSLGNLDSARVIKGLGYGFDEEALRVVKLAKFTPAYQAILNSSTSSNKSEFILVPVKCAINIPITFKLK